MCLPAWQLHCPWAQWHWGGQVAISLRLGVAGVGTWRRLVFSGGVDRADSREPQRAGPASQAAQRRIGSARR